MQRPGPGSAVGCPTVWKTLQVPERCLSVLEEGGKTTVEGGEEPHQDPQVLGPQCRRSGHGKGGLGEGDLGPGSASLEVDPSSLHPPTGGFQQLLLEPVLKFHYMLKKLQLHKEEYVLMQAISLFSPGESPTCLAWPPHAPPLFPQACSHPVSFSQGQGQHSFLCFPQGRFLTDGLALHSLLSQDGDSSCLLSG